MQTTTIRTTEWMSGFMSGLVCGEGNFAVAIAKHPQARLGFTVHPIFQIELSKKDRPLLETVRDFFGCGGLYDPKPRIRARNESPTSRYMVGSLSGCTIIERFFRTNPLIGIKQQAFEIWCQCLELIRNHEHTSYRGFMKIAELRHTMNQIRRPSTYRDYENLIDAAKKVDPARIMTRWSPEELQLIDDYFHGHMTRQELNEKIERPMPSIDNKITRLRKRDITEQRTRG